MNVPFPHIPMNTVYYQYNFLKLLIFSEWEREGEREGEKHQCERETLIGFLSQVP